MNKNLVLAVLTSFIAVSALLLSVRSPITAESLIGYGAVLAIVAMAAVEYRIDWKRIFGRG
ncbi:MAG: hypothetical protein Q7S40_07235 [Opitutaceae bacterium]|nr:hypothetical protein [Opitutaceae bacterium]